MVALSGNLKVMQDIFEKREKEFCNSTKQLTLNRAIRSGNIAMVNYLLDKGIKVQRGGEFNSPLEQAVFSGDCDMVKLILPHSGAASFDDYLSYDALETGSNELVKFVLGETIDSSPEATTRSASSGNLATLKLVIEQHHAIPTNDMLNAAAASGNVELLVYLLDPTKNFALVANIETLNAATTKGTKCFDYLIEKFVLTPDATTLESACSNGNLTIVKKLLSEYNLEPTLDLLNQAAKSGVLGLVKLLIEDYDITPDPTSLLYSFNSKNLNVVRYILQKGKLQPVPYSFARNTANSWVQLYLACEVSKGTCIAKGSGKLVYGEGELITIAGLDPKLFYLVLDDLLSSNADEKLKMRLIKLEIVQNSPLPMTQLFLALAQINLKEEKIISLLNNAYNGFTLLGHNDLALQAKSALDEIGRPGFKP